MLDNKFHMMSKTVWVDSTLNFEFEGHFQGRKGQIWSKIDML